jgi:hypothetical protein
MIAKSYPKIDQDYQNFIDKLVLILIEEKLIMKFINNGGKKFYHFLLVLYFQTLAISVAVGILLVITIIF